MKRIVATLAILFGLVLVPTTSVGAVDVFKDACSGRSDTSVCSGTGDNILGRNGILRNIINLLLTLAGVVAVIMIISGGIKYTLSDGDSGQTSAAKNTILYAVVGLVVAIMAFAIVNFVLGRI